MRVYGGNQGSSGEGDKEGKIGSGKTAFCRLTQDERSMVYVNIDDT